MQGFDLFFKTIVCTKSRKKSIYLIDIIIYFIYSAGPNSSLTICLMNALLRGLVRSDSVTTACKIAGDGDFGQILCNPD
jgi:hypothetical protein